ncbi:MAG: HK97 family phage prohead protease [Proteobacteria bacterium]|nr:HK97 family phage prohead protease [Pseudomonadota bacterium]
MNEILSYKSIIGEVKDVDTKKRVITGYLSGFDNKDHDGDIIVKGAFKKSINERKENIFFLNQHDWKQPHGKFNVLQEDTKGLYFESQPLIDTSYSSDTLKLYEAGIVKEHSIGFQTMLSNYDNKADARIIKEVKLYEGSNVTLGANSDTPFTGFKSLTLKEVNEQHKLILKAFRDGNFTDETFSLLEIALKQLQKQSYELGKKSLIKEVEPINVTHEVINEPIDYTNIIKNFNTTFK